MRLFSTTLTVVLVATCTSVIAQDPFSIECRACSVEASRSVPSCASQDPYPSMGVTNATLPCLCDLLKNPSIYQGCIDVCGSVDTYLQQLKTGSRDLCNNPPNGSSNGKTSTSPNATASTTGNPSTSTWGSTASGSSTNSPKSVGSSVRGEQQSFGHTLALAAVGAIGTMIF